MPGSISKCDVNRRYYMLLLFLFVLLLFFVVFFLFILFIFVFFMDRNMISIGIVKFRCYVVIIILVNLGKTLSCKGLRQLRLISIQWTYESDFHLDFCVLYFMLSEFLTNWCFGVYSQSNLLDRTVWLHCYQACP